MNGRLGDTREDMGNLATHGWRIGRLLVDGPASAEGKAVIESSSSSERTLAGMKQRVARQLMGFGRGTRRGEPRKLEVDQAEVPGKCHVPNRRAEGAMAERLPARGFHETESGKGEGVEENEDAGKESARAVSPVSGLPSHPRHDCRPEL